MGKAKMIIKETQQKDLEKVNRCLQSSLKDEYPQDPNIVPAEAHISLCAKK
jgi:hypothetical protein